MNLIKCSELRSNFELVISLGITPKHWLWGVMGGAGAVVSMTKRFDEIEGPSGSYWLFLAKGFSHPSVGSISAIVVCSLMYPGLEATFKFEPNAPLLAVSFLRDLVKDFLEKYKKNSSRLTTFDFLENDAS